VNWYPSPFRGYSNDSPVTPFPAPPASSFFPSQGSCKASLFSSSFFQTPLGTVSAPLTDRVSELCFVRPCFFLDFGFDLVRDVEVRYQNRHHPRVPLHNFAMSSYQLHPLASYTHFGLLLRLRSLSESNYPWYLKSSIKPLYPPRVPILYPYPIPQVFSIHPSLAPALLWLLRPSRTPAYLHIQPTIN